MTMTWKNAERVASTWQASLHTGREQLDAALSNETRWLRHLCFRLR